MSIKHFEFSFGIEETIPPVAKLSQGVIATELTVKELNWNDREPIAKISNNLSDKILKTMVKPIARTIDKPYRFDETNEITWVNKPSCWITKINGTTFETKISAKKNFPSCTIQVPEHVRSRIGVSDTNDRIVIFSPIWPVDEQDTKFLI
ncbi:MAG: hypothetical protein KAS30_05770 [Candidatus Diapherotrites archaeon]|nr:hypothetical protein [Candidatus Diapherotrites archaeon]